MLRLIPRALAALALLAGPAAAQSFTLPELGLQNSGVCRQLAARDRTSNAMVPLGCLDTSKRGWTLTPNNLQIQGAGSSGPVDGMSVTPPGRGAASTLSSLFDSTMSLASFGAKDDNATDNTAAVQAAVNAASTLGRTLVVSASTGGTGVYRIGTVNWQNVSLRLDNSTSFANLDGSAYSGGFAGNPPFAQAVRVGAGILGQQGRKVELPGAIYKYTNALTGQAAPTFASFQMFDGQPTGTNSALLAYGPAVYGYVGIGQSGTVSAGSGGIFSGQMNVFRANNGPGVTFNCTLNNGSIYAVNCTSTAGVFDPAKITSTTTGIPANTFVDVSGVHPGVSGTIALDTTYAGTTMDPIALSVNGVQFTGSLFNNSPYIAYASGIANATVGSTVTRVSDGFVLGKVVSAAMDTIKMSAPFAGTSTAFQGATLNAVSGRGEITPLTYAVNLSKDFNMPGLSIYSDISHSSNTSSNPADQEGYLSGITNFVTKWAPGWAIDRLHQGSFGLQTMTRPGPGGYDYVDRTGQTSYPLLAGNFVGGWSGLYGTATDGASAAATPGFWVGSQIGSLGYNGTALTTTGCGVWCATATRSKFGYGEIISDYTMEGLRIANPIGTPGAALHVVTGAGDSFFDTNVITKGSIFELTPGTPASSSASCTAGQRTWDTNYEYRCVATNRWRRIAFTSDWP